MVDYTEKVNELPSNYQQRALYGAGQSASRAQQRFHMERKALERGDKKEAKYHRSRANALNRQGAYAAVSGMGGDQGENQYFPVQSSGQPIYSTNFPGQFMMSGAGRDVFDKFRDTGFVEPIRQKKRYAPNTEPKGLGWLAEKALGNTILGKIASNILPKKKPKPDDAYYKSLWGKGLNEMYGPSGIFTSGDFLGEPELDPYYDDSIGADAPLDFVPGINEITPEGMDKVIPPYGIAPLIPEHIRRKTIFDLTNEDEGIFYRGRGELSPDFDYEEEREGRELSLKRAFLKSINPYIDYDSMPSYWIETIYEDELNKQKIVPKIKLKPERDEIIPQIEESEKNKLPFHSIRSMPGFE